MFGILVIRCQFYLGFARQKVNLVMGVLNSVIGSLPLSLITPTMNNSGGDVAKVPAVTSSQDSSVGGHVSKAIAGSRDDYDSFETSRDFKRHPLMELAAIWI